MMIVADATAGSSSSDTPMPSLAPREHGAYAQLGLPLAVALGLAASSFSAWCFALAACAAFVAHEPLRVLLGHRGGQAKQRASTRARQLLWSSYSVALCAGGLGIAFAPDAARLGVVGALALGFVVLPFTARDAEKSFGGEMAVAAALPFASLPVLLAGSVPAPRALVMVAAWILAFWGATAAVRATLAHHRRESLLSSMLLLATAIGATFALGLGVSSAAFAAAPVLAMASGILGLRPHPRQLRRVGWSLIAATTVMSVLCVVLA